MSKDSQPLRRRDIEALLILDFELPSIRESVHLAEIIAESWKPGPVKHPVLAFAIDKTTPSVIENLLLRVAEVLERVNPLLS